jgi:4-amino-4-deoxy-L-arabinose transferase-like glycosyltransferase
MPSTNRLPTWSLPLLVFATALAVRLSVIWFWQFDGLYGQDAFAYYDRSVDLAHRVVHGWSALPPFFWPHGYPILGAAAILAAGEGPVGPQLVNTVFGGLLAVLVYFFARDLDRGSTAASKTPPGDGEACGLVAGLCTALAGQPVLSSVVVMSDASAAFWLTLAAWLVWRQLREPERWWLLPSAAAAAAAALVTRRASVLALPALAAVAGLAVGRIRRPVPAVLFGLVVAVLVAAPQLFLLESFDGADTYLAGWRPANAFARSFDTANGLQSHRLPNGVFYLAPFWHPVLMPPTLGLFAVFGLWTLWRRQRAALVLTAGWYATAYLFLVGLPQQNLRFCLTLWTPAVVLAALGVVAAWSRRRRATAIAIVLSVVMAPFASYWWLDRFMRRAHQVRTVAEAVATHLPEGGRVLAFGITSALDHYTRADVFELFSLDEPTLAWVSDGAEPTLVVIDRGNVEAQWADRNPGRNLRWLERERGLSLVEQIGPWSVSRVIPGKPLAEHVR